MISNVPDRDQQENDDYEDTRQRSHTPSPLCRTKGARKNSRSLDGYAELGATFYATAWE
jgi:hypothetical protein